jgi:hypothetical protein
VETATSDQRKTALKTMTKKTRNNAIPFGVFKKLTKEVNLSMKDGAKTAFDIIGFSVIPITANYN